MSSYQSIPTAAAASSIDGGEHFLALSPQESSSSSDDNNNNRSHHRRGGVVMAAAASATLLLLLLLAFLSGRSYSSLGYETNLDDMNIIQKDNAPNRLCEVYHDPTTSRTNKDKSSSTTTVVRLFETSFGEPSQPWQEVPCIHRYNHRLLDSLLSS